MLIVNGMLNFCIRVCMQELQIKQVFMHNHVVSHSVWLFHQIISIALCIPFN